MSFKRLQRPSVCSSFTDLSGNNAQCLRTVWLAPYHCHPFSLFTFEVLCGVSKLVMWKDSDASICRMNKLKLPAEKGWKSSPVLSPVQVSLLNYVFLACWAFALPYSQYRPLASSICTVWTCVIIVCKMLYQLKSIQPTPYNCTIVNIILTRAVCTTHCYH